jgi:hypothetical protein
MSRLHKATIDRPCAMITQDNDRQTLCHDYTKQL